LISFSYEAAAKSVGVSSHRHFITLFHEDLVTVSLILCPRAVQVEALAEPLNNKKAQNNIRAVDFDIRALLGF